MHRIKHNRKLSLIIIMLSAVMLMSSLFAKDAKDAKDAKEQQETVITSSIIKQRVEGKYFDVAQSVRSAILGKGIHIAHELHASEMLQRTSSAFGYDKAIYSNAEIFEFCSSGLSHKLSRIDPDNIVMCPFTIGVYALLKEKDTVYITYQVPRGKPGTEEVIKEIEALLSEIVEDAMW